MRQLRPPPLVILVSLVSLLSMLRGGMAAAPRESLGIFTNVTAVGGSSTRGRAEFDPSAGDYRITSARTEAAGNASAFQYLWRETTGDFELAANVRFLDRGFEHTIAGIMVRQTIEDGSRHAGFVIDGVGMPGLQWRGRPGEAQRSFNFPAARADTVRMRLARKGITVYVSIGRNGSPLTELAHIDLTLQDPVLVGFMVATREAGTPVTAYFSDVEMSPPAR